VPCCAVSAWLVLPDPLVVPRAGMQCMPNTWLQVFLAVTRSGPVCQCICQVCCLLCLITGGTTGQGNELRTVQKPLLSKHKQGARLRMTLAAEHACTLLRCKNAGHRAACAAPAPDGVTSGQPPHSLSYRKHHTNTLTCRLCGSPCCPKTVAKPCMRTRRGPLAAPAPQANSHAHWAGPTAPGHVRSDAVTHSACCRSGLP